MHLPLIRTDRYKATPKHKTTGVNGLHGLDAKSNYNHKTAAVVQIPNPENSSPEFLLMKILTLSNRDQRVRLMPLCLYPNCYTGKIDKINAGGKAAST